MRKTLLTVTMSLVGAFLLIQLVPYRVSNPSARQEPSWDSPRTRALAVAACFDCHSNQVRIPWYGNIAPVSWLITKHVNDGRASLNFSQWKGKRGESAGDAAETVRNGSMPPSYYRWFGLHGSSKLTPTQRDELARGLTISLSR